MQKNLFTYPLDSVQSALLRDVCFERGYTKVQVPYAKFAYKGPNFNLVYYTSGKLVIQGKGAEEFVLFTLEPEILQCATLGYEEVLDPKMFAPHMGSDESGKGDIFGPLITVAAFIDETTGKRLVDLGIRDSKTIADGKIMSLATEIKKIIGRNNIAFVLLRPPTYNRLYAKIANVNRLLAWCHARAIESLAEQRPDCPRAVIDQFAKTEATINRALMPRGKKLIIEQMHKAEQDIAVATASVLARAFFVSEMKKLSETFSVELPKGAGPKVPQVLGELIAKQGPACLPQVAKCHFKTVAEALEAKGFSRDDLPEPSEA